LTYINRNWVNDFDWYPGDIYDLQFSDGSTQKVVRRVLKNSSGYERSINSVEFEWDIPFNKRVNFGGSYTYARLMSNYPGRTDSPRADNFSNISMSLDWWWDQMVPGGRSTWSPVRLIQPEHFWKWYLLFDMSSGKLRQSVSFNGQYQSSSFWSDGYYYSRGYAYDVYPQFFASPNGGNVAGSEAIPSGWSNVGPLEYTLGNYFTRGNDSWNLSMRYHLEVPVAMKLVWFADITISNPFNHRGITDSGAFNISGSSGQRIESYLSGNGVVPDRVPNDPYQGVWKNAGDVNGAYIQRMGGRSVSVQTGFRF
jgi:hypothetical protein